MKILIDARLWGLENAGLGRYTINLVNHLVKIDNKNNYGILLRSQYFNRLNFPDRWKKISVDFKHYSLLEQILLPKIINNENPDLIHFLHFNVPILINKPFVVTLHDLLMHKQRGLAATTLPLYSYLFKRIGYKVVFDNAVKKSQKIIVPSNFVKQELTSTYHLNAAKIHVAYEGVDEKISVKGNASEVLNKYGLSNQKYFIYTGNAYPHKNLDRVIEATLFLNKLVSEKVLFVIATSRNVFASRLQKTIHKIGASQYAKFLGFVPDSDLGILFRNSLAYIFPSLSEGFGLSGLEAMKAGTLVLASDIAVFKEIYKDKAIFFNPFDFSSIQKAMSDAFYMDKKKRIEKIKALQEFTKQYSWTKMAKETLKVYETSLSTFAENRERKLADE